MRFQDVYEKNLSSDQLIIVIVENILEEKEPEVFAISEIPEEQVELEKGYYSCVYIMHSLIRRLALKVRRSSWMWRMIMKRRIRNMSSLTMRENVSVEWFSRKIMDGWIIRRHCYMISGGVSM